MSGNTAPAAVDGTNFNPATDDQVSQGIALLFGVQSGTENSPRPVGLTVTPQQIAGEAEVDGLVTGTLNTTDATPGLLPNLPVMPNQRCACRLTGQITAQIIATGDAASWDLVMLLKRVGAGLAPVLMGSAITQLPWGDQTLSGCTVVAGVGSGGASVIVTGLASTPIEWGLTLTVVISE